MCIFNPSVHTSELQIIEIRAKYPSIAAAIGSPLQVNGVGMPKLCADLSTMMQILWLLPSNPRTTAFRLKCADDMVRQMRGDPTLVAELERNRAILEATDAMHFNEVSVPQIACETKVTTLTAYEERQIQYDARKRYYDLEEIRLAQRERELVIAEANNDRDEKEHGLRLVVLRQEHDQKLDLNRESHVDALIASHTRSMQDRMAFLAANNLLCDYKRLAIADDILNYDPRKYISAPSDCRALSAPNELPAPVSLKPMQIGEIMRFELGMSADVIREYGAGAGTRVSKLFKDQFGKGTKMLKARRIVDGQELLVNAYARSEMAWIKDAIVAYLREKEEETKAETQKAERAHKATIPPTDSTDQVPDDSNKAIKKKRISRAASVSKKKRL